MTISAAINATGTQLQLGDGAAPENFTAISEQITIDGPNIKQEFDDVTTMLSTQGFRERIAVLRDAGTITLTCNYLPNDTTQNASRGLFYQAVNGIKSNYKIVAPGAIATVAFAALVADVHVNFMLGKAMNFTVTLQITGAPTLP